MCTHGHLPLQINFCLGGSKILIISGRYHAIFIVYMWSWHLYLSTAVSVEYVCRYLPRYTLTFGNLLSTAFSDEVHK